MIKAVVNYFKCLFQLSGCKSVHKLLFDYVQGNLSADLKQELDHHLSDCPGCMEYVKTYAATIRATHQFCPKCTEIPPEVERKLKEFIQLKL
jgi:anti-sigma factor RsiW